MTFDLDRYADEMLSELEELPVVSAARWRDACASLEANGCDSSILHEIARDDGVEETD